MNDSWIFFTPQNYGCNVWRTLTGCEGRFFNCLADNACTTRQRLWILAYPFVHPSIPQTFPPTHSPPNHTFASQEACALRWAPSKFHGMDRLQECFCFGAGRATLYNCCLETSDVMGIDSCTVITGGGHTCKSASPSILPSPTIFLQASGSTFFFV